MSSDSPAVVVFSIDGYDTQITNTDPDGTEYALITRNIPSGVQEVSGTISALTNGTQRTKLTDGTNNAALSNNIPVGTEQALVVRNIPSGTQTVNGTITSNIGTTNGLALDATLTSGTIKSQIYDGTNVLGTTAHPVKTDPTGTTTQPVSGTVIANIGTTNGLALDATTTKLTISQGAALGSNTQTLMGGSVTTTSPSYTTGNINPLSLTTAGALRVDGSGTTQPVSGTITSNIGTTNGLVLDTTLTNGAAKIQVFDGINVIGTSAHPVKIDPTGTTIQPVSGTITANAGSGTFTVGGTVTANVGTTNGLALDTSINGILLSQGSSTSGEKGPLMQGAVTTSAPSYTTAQTSPLSLTTSGGLRVDGSGTTQPISGTITANAGSGTFAVSGSVTSAQSGIWTIQQGTTGAGASSPWSMELSDGAVFYTAAKTGQFPSALIGGRLDVNTGSWLGSTAPTVGSKTSANSIPVVIASDQVAVPVSGTITANIGTTNGIALDASIIGLQVAQGSNTSGQKGELIQGAVTTAAPTYTTGQTSPFSLTTAGALRIDGSGATQPISGTITANAGSGTFAVSGTITSNIGTTNGLALDTTITKLTITQGTALDNNTQTLIGGSVTASAPSYTTGNINPLSLTTAGLLRVDGSGTTQPVSGTVTANAGSGTFAISGTVTSNIGTTNGLALDASVTGLQVSQGSTTSGQKGELIQGAVTTSAPSYITAQTSPLSLTTAGALRIDGSATTQPVSGTVTANAGSGTFAVSGTVTSNIGTTNGLALDTSINGIIVSQGSATSGEKGTLIQGAVTTASPSYTTAQTSPLSLTTAGALRVDGSSITQPVSGTITSNQGTANTLANKWPVQITDGTNTMPIGDVVARSIFHKITDGTNTAAMKAASTAAAAADPSLVVALSPNSTLFDANGNAMGRQNKTAVPSTLGLLPSAGIDGGVTVRSMRVGDYGTTRTTSEVLLWQDAFEGSTINTFWTQSLTTMTAVQATGVLTLNNSAITTVNTDAIITSKRQFPKYVRQPLYGRFRTLITANVAANHTLAEFGFGAPSGVTAIINDGAFFRWRVDGSLAVVLSYNGTEQVTQVLAQGTIATTSYYFYDIIVDDDFTRFIVSDASGTAIVDTQVSLSLTVPCTWSVSHLPTFARVYTDATGGGTAVQLKISAHTVQILDALLSKSWDEQLVSLMHHASINPTTYAQTGSSMTAAPGTETPSNTVGGYNALGGDFAVALTPTAAEAPLSVFAFQIPSPYSFYLHGLIFSDLFVTTAISVTGIPILEWFVITNCASGNINTGGGQRFPIGLCHLYTSATQAAGIFCTTQGNRSWLPPTPIICLPGTFLHIGYKVFITSAAGTPGVTRGSVFVDGKFE